MIRPIVFAICFLAGYAVSIYLFKELTMFKAIGLLLFGILVGYIGRDIIKTAIYVAVQTLGSLLGKK